MSEETGPEVEAQNFLLLCPADVLLHMCTTLCPRDLAALACTCSHLRHVAQCDVVRLLAAISSLPSINCLLQILPVPAFCHHTCSSAATAYLLSLNQGTPMDNHILIRLPALMQVWSALCTGIYGVKGPSHTQPAAWVAAAVALHGQAAPLHKSASGETPDPAPTSFMCECRFAGMQSVWTGPVSAHCLHTPSLHCVQGPV